MARTRAAEQAQRRQRLEEETRRRWGSTEPSGTPEHTPPSCCEAWDFATAEGSDGEGYGALIFGVRYGDGIGHRAGMVPLPLEFCPWCGARVAWKPDVVNPADAARPAAEAAADALGLEVDRESFDEAARALERPANEETMGSVCNYILLAGLNNAEGHPGECLMPRIVVKRGDRAEPAEMFIQVDDCDRMTYGPTDYVAHLVAMLSTNNTWPPDVYKAIVDYPWSEPETVQLLELGEGEKAFRLLSWGDILFAAWQSSKSREEGEARYNRWAEGAMTSDDAEAALSKVFGKLENFAFEATLVSADVGSANSWELAELERLFAWHEVEQIVVVPPETAQDEPSYRVMVEVWLGRSLRLGDE